MKKQKGRKEEKSPCRRNLGTAQQAGTSTWLWARWSGVRQVNRAPAAFLASASQIGFAPKVTEVLREWKPSYSTFIKTLSLVHINRNVCPLAELQDGKT